MLARRSDVWRFYDFWWRVHILDFKTAAEKGIATGKIKSIIDPALADHVRREAIKAADDLRRAA